MAGLGIRVFTDEHIFKDFAAELRRRGYDAESCHEAGRANRAISDEDQLVYATESGRAILTENRADFLQLDARWKDEGRRHAGIILVAGPIFDFGSLLRQVEHHLSTYGPSEQFDAVLWLDTSRTS